MTNERLIEIALGGDATKEESEAMAMLLLNWKDGTKDEETEKKEEVKDEQTRLR